MRWSYRDVWKQTTCTQEQLHTSTFYKSDHNFTTAQICKEPLSRCELNARKSARMHWSYLRGPVTCQNYNGLVSHSMAALLSKDLLVTCMTRDNTRYNKKEKYKIRSPAKTVMGQSLTVFTVMGGGLKNLTSSLFEFRILSPLQQNFCSNSEESILQHLQITCAPCTVANVHACSLTFPKPMHASWG